MKITLILRFNHTKYEMKLNFQSTNLFAVEWLKNNQIGKDTFCRNPFLNDSFFSRKLKILE